MNELVISIKNAYKKFGEQVVLNDVSLEIYKGRIYGIIGRNGSGKTVLFKSICGFILLDSRLYRKTSRRGQACPLRNNSFR